MFKSSVNRQRRRPGVRAYCTLSRPAPPLHLMVRIPSHAGAIPVVHNTHTHKCAMFAHMTMRPRRACGLVTVMRRKTWSSWGAIVLLLCHVKLAVVSGRRLQQTPQRTTHHLRAGGMQKLDGKCV